MRKVILIPIATVLILGAAGFGYTRLAARIGSGTPPAAAALPVDRVLVEKSARRLTLLRGGRPVAIYDIALGGDADGGPKQFEGDERTPEGHYVIDWRNPNSVAHLSLHISYPDQAARDAAAAQDRSPGGDIMIHGLPNGWGFLGRLHLLADWTDGCIAVTNAQMREIWSLVPNGTPIEIRADVITAPLAKRRLTGQFRTDNTDRSPARPI